MTQLYKIADGRLNKVPRKRLEVEDLVQKWVAEDLRLVGLDAIVIGQKVTTAHDKEVDILAMDQDGSLIIIELKRDRTPRDVIAQALDYASWVRTLTTAEVYEIYSRKNNNAELSEAFKKKFNGPIPDALNATHQILIVASEFDEASRRIVEYLSEEYGVGINASFFCVFESESDQWLTTDFLLDQDEVTERATKKTRGHWTGYYYATGGTEQDRPWEDLRTYNFITANGGRRYIKRLDALSVGDKLFYYQVGKGYLGFGEVVSPRVAAKDFKVSDGRVLTDVLPKPYLLADADDPDLAAYVVGVNWIKTFDRSEAKTFPGIFANQNVVCKIYQADTARYLEEQFGVTAAQLSKT
jgi:hypothetical protein